MFKHFILLSAMILGVIGCDVQRGRFSTSGDSSGSFSSHVGCINIVDGYGAKPVNGANKDEGHLLYILIICPGAQEIGSGGSSDYGKYVTTLNHMWTTKTGTLAVSVRWNREDDTVEVGKQNFIREKGNVFVVRLEQNKEIDCQQLANLGPHASFQQVLEHVRQQLPKDELIASLELHK